MFIELKKTTFSFWGYMMQNQVYDIRTSEAALNTLVSLTGVDPSVWKALSDEEDHVPVTFDLLADTINTYGRFPSRLDELEMVYIHVTTSANGCESIKKHGIQDLATAYANADSELRVFLDEHDIHIDLENRILTHAGREFDIAYRPCLQSPNDDDYWRKSVGKKFYNDHATCGFFSVDNLRPYGGLVHMRPEVLNNIGHVVHLDLCLEWHSSHSPYEIIARVKCRDIVYNNDTNEDELHQYLYYLLMAYYNAFFEPSERILLTKNNVRILPQDVTRIAPISFWNHL